MAQDSGGAQFGYDDHFTPARTRKKRKNRPPTEPPSPSVLLDRTSDELVPSEWFRDTKRILRDALDEAFSSTGIAPDVLCLGLGSPSASRDARAQLAFLLAACDDLRIERTRVSVFDPVFSKQDIQLLAQRGVIALLENREARHAFDTPMIAFMPHCDLHLYENLFHENWSEERLRNVLLIANRLSDYADSIPSRKLAAEYPCIVRLVPHLTSGPLPPCALYPSAFNNIAVQYLSAASLAERALDHDWWALPNSNPPIAPAPAASRASPDAHKTSSDGDGDRVERAPAQPPGASSTVPPRTLPSCTASATSHGEDGDGDGDGVGESHGRVPPRESVAFAGGVAESDAGSGSGIGIRSSRA